MTPRPALLVADDDEAFATELRGFLQTRYEVLLAHRPSEVLDAVASERPDLVLLDLELGIDGQGFEVLRALRHQPHAPAVLILTADRDVRSAVRAMKQGAFHYICKPPDLDELTNLLHLALEQKDLRRHVAALESELTRLSGDFVAADANMREIVRRVERVAPTPATVLITGECGTGKEMVARLLHAHSQRSEQPFVGVNCAAVPGDLIESELFGHERGAFTGADRVRTGKFELAGRGTIFLDEIGDSTEAFQLKLLRVLEDRRFYRVGADSESRLEARVCAATSMNLEEAASHGRFREELFYRLDVYRVHVPPLRERRDDVPVLAQHFMKRSARAFGHDVHNIDDEAMDYLRKQPWHGNVRELRNVIERAALECDGEEIGIEHVLIRPSAAASVHVGYDDAKSAVIGDFKRQYLSAQLRRASGSITRAAELSSLTRQSFGRMLREVGLEAGRFRKRGPD